MDLRTNFPRSPRDQLNGMTILARAIDTAQAELEGTLGDYVFWDCPMNDVLFGTLGVSAAAFLDAVREARRAASPAADDFLAAARESPEDPTFLSDQQIVTAVEMPEIDARIIAWIESDHRVDRERVAEMNVRLEALAPSTSLTN